MDGGVIAAASVALALSVAAAAGTIRAARRLGVGIDHVHADHKTHSHWVPRLGGIPIFLALAAGCAALVAITGQYVRETMLLLVCCVPAFGIGLVEDFTQKAGVLVRLALTMVAAGLGWWLLDARLTYLDLIWIDPLLAPQGWFAFGFTLVAASGLSHAINMIDGCNGLSSFVAIVVLSCLGIVAYQVGDGFVGGVAMVSVAALLGFFLWNFPMGRLFMGDAGAYLSGILIALLSILLVRRNPEVSPWFPMLLMAYPVWETLFSMYRRAVIHRSSMGAADKLHLHQLIYFRLVRWFQHSPEHRHQAVRSAITSTYLWALSLLCALPALAFWDSAAMLKAFCVVFICSYLLLHASMVRFHAPRVLIVRRARAAAMPLPEETVAAGSAGPHNDGDA